MSTQMPLVAGFFGGLQDIIEDQIEVLEGRASAHGWEAGVLKPWSTNARPSQIRPRGDDWTFWLLRTGRGFGKGFAESGNAIDLVKRGEWRKFALVAPTQNDIRHTMIEGETGILEMAAVEGIGATYFPSLQHQVRFENGARCWGYSDEKPGRLRGPSRDGALVDELREWRNGAATWDNLIRILRLGRHPRIIGGTTPPSAASKKPISYKTLKWLRELEKLPYCKVTTGSSLENIENLSPSYKAVTIDPFIGTRIGRREVEGLYEEDVEGALWTTADIEASRIAPNALPELVTVAVGVDPPGSTGTECGIVAAGVDEREHVYIVADESMLGLPQQWAAGVARTFESTEADVVVAEVNFGGDMVESVLQVADPLMPVEKIRASRGKYIRAQPVSTLWEPKIARGHFVGHFPALEDECVTYTPDSPDSPNRLDALVWAVTFALQGGRPMIGRAG